MKLVVDGLIFQKDPHGGIARAFREILPRVCAADPDVSVILFTDGPLRSELPAHPQIIHRRLPTVRPTLRPIGVFRRLLYPLRRSLGSVWDRTRQGWLQDVRDGVWHSTFYTLPESWAGSQVVTVHDVIPERFPQFYNDPLDEIGRQRKRRCIQEADLIVCDTQATRAAVESLYSPPPESLITVHLAYSKTFHMLPPDEREQHADVSTPYLLYVGGRFGYKNFSSVVEAFSSWSRRSELSLVCVGRPWRPDELRLISASGAGERIRLLQDVDDLQLCRLYNGAAGLIYPSLEEGFGVPLLEAMACGCPVAASRIPTTLEIAGDVPHYFDPADPSDLRAALDRLLEGDLSARRAAGLERAAAFSWENTARKMLDVYRTVDERRNRRGQA